MSDRLTAVQAEEATTGTPLTEEACQTAREVFKWADGGHRNVRVVIHRTGTGFLYHRGMGESGIVPLSEGDVQEWLERLTNGR